MDIGGSGDHEAIARASLWEKSLLDDGKMLKMLREGL